MNQQFIFNNGGVRLRHCSLFTVHCSLPRGMTLVELLVAVSIMVMLVAISVPMFKPMLESQKTAGGARTVALALQRARVKAMETGIPHGIEFQRFTTASTASTTAPALQLYLVSGGKPIIGIVGNITAGNAMTPSVLSGGDVANWAHTTTAAINVQVGDRVQLNYHGDYYRISTISTNRAEIQKNGVIVGFPTAMNNVPYKLLRQPRTETKRLSLVPPMTMPRGTVVDLLYSGFDYLDDSGNYHSGDFFDQGNPDPTGFTGTPVPAPPGSSVVVMFAPNGTVDRVYYVRYKYDTSTSAWYPEIENDLDDATVNSSYADRKFAAKLIYFCIGEWDRQIDDTGSTLAEDGKGNLQTASNFWVTINPRTGEIRTAEIYPTTNPTISTAVISTARRFATEQFVNIGE